MQYRFMGVMKLPNIYLAAVLFLLPAQASALTNHVFSPACGTKVNERILREAVRSIAPQADVIFTDCSGNRFKEGVEIPNSATPARLVVYNVPNQFTRQQVRQFLINHNPTESTDEERKRANIEYRNSKLQQLPSYQDLLRRIEALEARLP